MLNQKIDRDKLRTAIRGLGDEYIYQMLSEAIDMLPQPKLEKLTKHYLHPEQLIVRDHIGERIPVLRISGD